VAEKKREKRKKKSFSLLLQRRFGQLIRRTPALESRPLQGGHFKVSSGWNDIQTVFVPFVFSIAHFSR
jgi:hypothetical protein